MAGDIVGRVAAVSQQLGYRNSVCTWVDYAWVGGCLDSHPGAACRSTHCTLHVNKVLALCRSAALLSIVLLVFSIVLGSAAHAGAPASLSWPAHPSSCSCAAGCWRVLAPLLCATSPSCCGCWSPCSSTSTCSILNKWHRWGAHAQNPPCCRLISISSATRSAPFTQAAIDLSTVRVH